MDTNSVHYLRLYLELAKEHDLPPYGTGSGDITNDLKQFGKSSKKVLSSYKKGHSLLEELKKRSDAGWRIHYSRFTRFELSCGALRAKAIEDALNEKMPSRWWGRFEEIEILDRLERTQYETVGRDIDQIETLFDSAGIVLTEFSVRFEEVFQMAKVLLDSVFLEVADCIVYACALVSEAEEFWTADGYLRTIVERIEDPTMDPDRQQDFEAISTRVKDALAHIIRIDVSQVHLPKAKKP